MSRETIQTEIARLEMAYLNHYTRMQYHWVQFFTEHLSDASREFKGDLQQMLILAVVGQRVLEQTRGQTVGALTISQPEGISASRLADVTGIPRQTVRRKLQALADKGWVEQRPDGQWAIRLVNGMSPAAGDLHDLDRRGIARIARLTAELRRLSDGSG
jgi:DNA-binding MarR family transcriptional regulator